MKKFFKFKGETLIELVLAMGLAALIFPALLGAFMSTREGKAQENVRMQAIALLKETEQAVKSVRSNGWNTFINVTMDSPYHPLIASSKWTLSSGTQTTNGLTQSVVISNVSRNSNGDIVTSGGTDDPSTKKVTITISWTQPFTSSITSTTYYTRSVDATYTNTKDTDFSPGTLSNTQVTKIVDGEVLLANNNKGKWCSPSFSSTSIDLPDGPPVAVVATASAISIHIPNDVFAATAPNDASTDKMAFVQVSADTDSPIATQEGVFTMDPAQYSTGTFPSGTGLDNNFKTNDIKYYTSTGGKLYALLATDKPDKEVVAIQIDNGDGKRDAFQDPTNKIFKYWTFFNTKMFVPSTPSLINGNFETGSTTPFTTIINSGSGAISNTTVHGGTYSNKVSTSQSSVSGVAGGGNCSGGKRIAIDPNVIYNFSGWINVPTSGNTRFKDARIRVAYYSACSGGSAISTSDSNLVTTTGGGWINVTGTANSGTGTFAEIQLLLDSSSSGTTSTAYFDDITFAISSTFNDQAPFGYGGTNLTIMGNTGYVDASGYLYTFDLSNIDSKSPSNELNQIGCRILLDGYDCQPNNGTDMKYAAGETGGTWSDTTTPAHLDCHDGGNVEINADHQISGVTVGSNKYIYVAVGAATNPELDVVDVSTPPGTVNSSSCGRGGDTGWKVAGNLDFDPYPNTEEAANSVYAKSDGTRAYMSSNGGIMHNGIPDSDQFYIIDTTTKSSPKFLTTWPSTQLNPPTPTPAHYQNTAQSGYYNGNSTNIELYPRRALTVQDGKRAILVGQDGIPNDGIEPQEYQVLDLSNESTPAYCGGLNFLSGFNDLTSVSQLNGDNYVYMVANTTSKELKIIQGGPDNAIYVSSGTYESPTYDAGASSAFNNFTATVNQPSNTTIKMQVAVAPPVNGSCTNAVFSYVGPGGDPAQYFTPNVASISGTIPYGNYLSNAYQNPGRCYRYKVWMSTTDQTQTPTLYDFTANYSP